MYGLFYPETGARYLPYRDFETLQEVEDFMAEKSHTSVVKPQGDDLKAWLNDMTGDLLVARRLTHVGAVTPDTQANYGWDGTTHYEQTERTYDEDFEE